MRSRTAGFVCRDEIERMNHSGNEKDNRQDEVNEKVLPNPTGQKNGEGGDKKSNYDWDELPHIR